MPNKKDVSQIICRMFGHKKSRGYGNGLPYFTAHFVTVDNTQREHYVLRDRCDRCDQSYQIGKIHGPLSLKLPHGL